MPGGPRYPLFRGQKRTARTIIQTTPQPACPAAQPAVDPITLSSACPCSLFPSQASGQVRRMASLQANSSVRLLSLLQRGMALSLDSSGASGFCHSLRSRVCKALKHPSCSGGARIDSQRRQVLWFLGIFFVNNRYDKFYQSAGSASIGPPFKA